MSGSQSISLRCENGRVVQPLPCVCLYCGQPATEVRQKVFSEQAVWGAALSGLGLLDLGTRQVKMEAPVCEKHGSAMRRARRWKAVLSLLGLALVGIAWMAFRSAGGADASLLAFVPGISGSSLAGAMAATGFFLTVLMLAEYPVGAALVRVVSIDNTAITLDGLPDEFCDAVNRMVGEI